MKNGIALTALVLLLMVVPRLSYAADATPFDSAQSAPMMGPPPELAQLAFLIGNWDVKGRLKMDPSQPDWIEFAGTCSYEMIAGGTTIESNYRSSTMGMDFIGFGLHSYDRETQQWQAVWIDNVGARQSYYTGRFADGKLVMQGDEKFGGQSFVNRFVISDITDKSFQWKIEMSKDGQTWATSMEATYTRR